MVKIGVGGKYHEGEYERLCMRVCRRVPLWSSARATSRHARSVKPPLRGNPYCAGERESRGAQKDLVAFL